MEPSIKIRISVKNTKGSENKDLNTKTEKQTCRRKRVRRTGILWYAGGKTTMGAGNSQVSNWTDLLSQERNASPNKIMDIQDGKNPDPRNTCPECFSPLKPADIKGCSNALLQCTRCPTTQFLCSSCLYPCTSTTDPDSSSCTNTLCPLVSTLLTCGVVSDQKSKVLGCPEFRACPKCHNLIMHEKGCKFITCTSCRHQFCFICLQNDCKKDKENYWSLTCKKPRAERQRFLSPQA